MSNLKRTVVISIAVIVALYLWLFRQMHYAAFMDWWTGKPGHHWP